MDLNQQVLDQLVQLNTTISYVFFMLLLIFGFGIAAIILKMLFRSTFDQI